MLRIDGKNTLKKRRGTTKDIINEVLNTYQDTWHTTAELAETLRRNTEYDTCKAVFDFIVENVNYNEDPNGVQWIRTPARLLHDGEGDCKSMAILSASLLNNLGIPCFFRFVSFSKNNQITHVYTVTESGIIIDPVELIDGQPVFNYASQYTYKKDMNTTQISRLSGIGATEDIYTPYMADTYFWDNTIAENYLFSELDVINAYLTYINSADREYLNQLDRVVVAYNLYQRSKGYSELMKRAGRVLQTMEDSNMFTLATIDEDSRMANLGELIDTAIDMLLDNTTLSESGVYVDWWQTQIADKDYNGLSQQQIDNYKSNIGIGGKEEQKNAILTDMQKSAPYFLYLYLGEEWVRTNKNKYPAIYKKYKIEKSLFDSWVANANKILDKQTIYNNLRSGFLKKQGLTPEQFIQQTIDGQKRAKVGVIDPVTWAAIISGIVTIVIAVIEGIIKLCGQKMQSPDNFPSGTPDYNDLDTNQLPGNSNSSGNTAGNSVSNSSLIKYGAIALILLTFIKK